MGDILVNTVAGDLLFLILDNNDLYSRRLQIRRLSQNNSPTSWDGSRKRVAGHVVCVSRHWCQNRVSVGEYGSPRTPS